MKEHLLSYSCPECDGIPLPVDTPVLVTIQAMACSEAVLFLLIKSDRARCRPGRGTRGSGENFVEKKTHAESGCIIISSTYGLFHRPFRVSSPPGTLEVLPILQIRYKSPLVYTDVCSFSITHSLLVANNLESSTIMSTCSNVLAKDQGT